VGQFRLTKATSSRGSVLAPRYHFTPSSPRCEQDLHVPAVEHERHTIEKGPRSEHAALKHTT